MLRVASVFAVGALCPEALFLSIISGDNEGIKALSITEPGKSRVEKVDRPKLRGSEILIRVSGCRIFGTCEACLNNRQNFCENWQGGGVTLPGGMAEYAVAPESAVSTIGKLPFETAAFMEPLSCVLHGVNKLTIAPGAQVAVIGAGPIVVADRNEDRLKVAREDGAAGACVDFGIGRSSSNWACDSCCPG